MPWLWLELNSFPYRTYHERTQKSTNGASTLDHDSQIMTAHIIICSTPKYQTPIYAHIVTVVVLGLSNSHHSDREDQAYKGASTN